MEWQPIETAPLDGTDILIFTQSGIIEAYFCCGEWLQNVCDATHDGDIYLISSPSHWMPLPDSP